MTINEKKQLSNYIKGLVRESLGEVDMPKWHNELYGINDEDGFENDEASDFEFDDEMDTHNDFWEEMGKSQPGRHYEGPDIEDEPVYDDEEDEKAIAGINELRRLAESYARQSVAQILSEGKKKGSKKSKKRKNKKQKTSSRGKTILDFLKSDGVNAAAYAYELYGSKTDAEKAADRSKFYKKMKGKVNDTGVPYSFNSRELAHLANRKNKKLHVS